MRGAFQLAIACVLLTCVTGACQGEMRPGKDSNAKIEPGHKVTAEPKPQDKSAAGFEKNWRQYIGASQELALPVVESGDRPPGRRWEPRVTTECVQSEGTDLAPQVTLVWNEPVGDSAGASPQQRNANAPALRFDLALHHNGFARNYYSSAIATDTLQRFTLPPNSVLIKDEAAVLATGPGLFPRITHFTVEVLQDRDTARRVAQHTLVLRDLSQGVSYTIRAARRSRDAWSEIGRYALLTPVCPRGR